MNIESAAYELQVGVIVRVDGHTILLGDKRTYLDLGYVCLIPWSGSMFDPVCSEWMRTNAVPFPALPGGVKSKAEYSKDPVLVELAWRACIGLIDEGPMSIPSAAEAQQVMAARGVPMLPDGRSARVVDGRWEPVL